MAEGIGFSFDIIRDYLISEGGKVEYHKLIKHFKNALADPRNKEARVLFKDLVNKVAVVTTEGNQKFLSLRQQFISEIPKLPTREPQLVTNIQVNCNDNNFINSSYVNNSVLVENQNFINITNYPNGNGTFSYNNGNNYSTALNQQFNNVSQAKNPQLMQSVPPGLHQALKLSNKQALINQQNAYLSSKVVNTNQFYSTNTPNLAAISSHNVSSSRLNQNISNTNSQSNLFAQAKGFSNQDVSINPIHSNRPSIIQPKLASSSLNTNKNVLNRNSQANDKFSDANQNAPALPIKNINNYWSNPDTEDRPPKPPPRRKSFASTSNTYLNKKENSNHVKDNENFPQSTPKQFTDKIKEINELKFNSPGRVKEHAKKLNKMVSEAELKPPMPLTNNNSSIANHLNQAKDDSDSNDQLKRKWMVKSSCCDFNELLQMLKENPKLAEFKDITCGYTALHWAAKFNKPEIIKLIAGTYGLSPNVKTSGYTPLHLAAMYNHKEIIELLVKGYDADESIRDYSGRLASELVKRVHNNETENGGRSHRKTGHDSENNHSSRSSVSLLARTASLRQTHRQLLDRLPSKYRTVK